MPDVSRRAVVVGAAAGLAATLPGQASTSPVTPRLEHLSRLLDEDAAGLAADPVRVMGRIQGRLRAAAEAGLFDAWRGGSSDDGKVTLVGGRGGEGRWKVQLFRVAAGTSQPPHCHENLASCLVVLDGRLHVREFDRLRARETREFTTLRRAFDAELGPGEAILTAEDHRNAHWFGAVGGPALAVNFKASGYFRRDLPRLRNRRYLDPSMDAGEPFEARFIAPAEARSRFAARPL